MRTVARLVTRPASQAGSTPKQTDLFIGVMMKSGADALEPNCIYEIQEVLGELQIRKVGPAAMASGLDAFAGGTWGKDVSSLLRERGGYLFLTAAEYTNAWTAPAAATVGMAGSDKV